MILVDTSVWIHFFREEENEGARKFEEVLTHGYPFGLTGVIYQEVLQGALTEADFGQLKRYLGTQRVYQPSDTLTSYAEAAKLYFRCCRQGITIRSTIACLIVQVSLEHHLLLLHNDRDFTRMATVVEELKFF